MVYYILGFYYDANTKTMIERELVNLRNLSDNNTTELSESYIKGGLLDTDEMVLLNGVDHRLNFIGPYTAALRATISTVAGVSGNSSLR